MHNAKLHLACKEYAAEVQRMPIMPMSWRDFPIEIDFEAFSVAYVSQLTGQSHTLSGRQMLSKTWSSSAAVLGMSCCCCCGWARGGAASWRPPLAPLCCWACPGSSMPSLPNRDTSSSRSDASACAQQGGT